MFSLFCDCQTPFYMAVIDKARVVKFNGFELPHIFPCARNYVKQDICQMNNIRQICVAHDLPKYREISVISTFPNYIEKD